MNTDNSNHGLVTYKPPKLKNIDQRLAIRREQALSVGYVPHFGLAEIRVLAEVAGQLSTRDRLNERNSLLVKVLFDTCLRVSEAIAIRPCDLFRSGNGWQLRVWTLKRKIWGTVVISSSLAMELQSYAYRYDISPKTRIFPVNASRVFQIIQEAMNKAGMVKPDGVGTVHILRHSGALERLRQSRNPQSVQEQLRHSNIRGTMRYWKTLSHEESMRIQQEVDFQW